MASKIHVSREKGNQRSGISRGQRNQAGLQQLTLPILAALSGAAMVGLDWPYAAPRQRSALVAKSAQSVSGESTERPHGMAKGSDEAVTQPKHVIRVSHAATLLW